MWGWVASGPPVQSTARTGVLRAFSGSYRGLRANVSIASHGEGCQQCVLDVTTARFIQDQERTGLGGKEDKTRTTNSLLLNTIL